MHKLIRATTVPISLKVLLKGQLSFMNRNGFDVIGVSSGGRDLRDVQVLEKISIKEINMTRTISPIADLVSLWKFYRLCKSENPIIVHSHTPKAGIVCMLGAKLAGVPIRLHTVAGMPLMEANGIKRKVLDWVEKLTYRSATKIYPNSVGLYNFILRYQYTSKEKLKVLGNGSSNGINTSIFSKENVDPSISAELRSTLGIEEKDFVFVFIGRLVGDKGINELIEAFSTLERSDVKLLLVGPQEPDLDPLNENTQKEIAINPHIISVGFQKDVRPYFAIAHALVFPSYREGFPNVVMQAGAMELPAIVSNINGCNEIIVEGNNGIIIPVKNTDAIKNAMEIMVTDKAFYSQMKANSRNMIIQRYEQEIVWDALLKEYKSLLKDRELDDV
jgi:glycosyltransferase involved in cell wall biosynthesis